MRDNPTRLRSSVPLRIGAPLSEEPTPREYTELLSRLAHRPDALLLEGLVIRSLAQAVYQPTNIGHFGLALKEYAHFTSPIRRYPDLVVHRALKAALLPKAEGGASVIHADAKLAVREAQSALPDGHIKILPIATETAAAMFLAGSRPDADRPESEPG